MIRTTELTITAQNSSKFSERTYVVRIGDDNESDILVICDEYTGYSIAIDPKDWPELQTAIETLLGGIQEHATDATERP